MVVIVLPSTDNDVSNDDTAAQQTNHDRRRPSPYYHHYCFPKARFIFETESTDAQLAAEAECAPYFVDLSSLTEEELDRWRLVGLLPPIPPPPSSIQAFLFKKEEEEEEEKELLTVLSEIDKKNDNDDILPKNTKEEEIMDVIIDNDDSHHENTTPNENNNDDTTTTTPITTPIDSKHKSFTNISSSSFFPHSYYDIRLLRKAHITYLSNALIYPLSKGYVSLDSSHPWMIYWCLHSLDLLGYFDDGIMNEDDDDEDKDKEGGSSSSCSSSSEMKTKGCDDIEILHKCHLLQRIVSTLQHCYMEVPLEFDINDDSDVIHDERLRDFFLPLPREDDHSTTNMMHQKDVDESSSSLSSSKSSTKRTILGGGFGGGPQQLPHVATTYAAVLALSIVAGIGVKCRSSTTTTISTTPPSSNHPYYYEPGKAAMELLTNVRLQLYAFFLSLRVQKTNVNEGTKLEDPQSSTTAFRMQHDGEIDVRASYCILAPCYLLGLLSNNNNESYKVNGNGSGNGSDGIEYCSSNTTNDETTNPLLSASVSRYIASCQTFEGGFGAEPWNEAHGGYTFCALAALRILNTIPFVDVDALSAWLARRQMSYEGGFCGRTNKLVDGCYSFWQGGAVAVLDSWLSDNRHNDVGSTSGGNISATTAGTATAIATESHRESVSFDEVMLQRYILLCAQDVNGGLRDKPSKPRDFYHSCYNISGLSVAQHASTSWQHPLTPPAIDGTIPVPDGNEKSMINKFNKLFGDVKSNIVGSTDPVINIRKERVEFMVQRNHYLAKTDA